MLKDKQTRVVIDTNLWISFLISKNLQKLDYLLSSGTIRLIFSIELIEEIKVTTARPKLKKYFSENALTEMLSAIDPYTDLVIVTTKIEICRDPKDDFLLALCKDGLSDFLLTGDKDLLDIKKIGKTKIVTISDFLDQIM